MPLRHRYNIFEDIGCLGETYETLVAVILFHLPPSSSAPSPLSNVVLLGIKSFYNSRAQFRLLLSAAAHANLNLNRYIRLMALASTDLLLAIPLASFVLYSNVAVTGSAPGSPGRICIRISRGWCRCPAFIGVQTRIAQRASRRCGGRLAEAIKNYRGAFQSVARRVGYTTAGSASGLAQHPNTTSPSPMALRAAHPQPSPSSSAKDTPQKRGSFDSFCDIDLSASYGGIPPLEYNAEKAWQGRCIHHEETFPDLCPERHELHTSKAMHDPQSANDEE
ncbi:pheromone A receptor-domain-containing protein [Mycena leptocephala]|nr:pheromone A receptor-domain-containing protein [Mycena leptocephala]